MFYSFISLTEYLYTSLGGSCPADYYGTEFLVTFLSNNDDILQPELIFTPVDTASAVISVQSAVRTNFSSQFAVPQQSSDQLEVPSSFRSSGVQKTNAALRVRSDSNIAVYALDKDENSCGGFLVFPVHTLGKEYFALSWWPPIGGSQLSVVSTEPGTTITFQFQPEHGNSVTYNGVTYDENNPLTVQLDQYEVFHIQHNRDLSGTYITGDKPFALYAGNRYTEVRPTDEIRNVGSDALSEAIPPLSTFGYSFILASLDLDLMGYMIKVVASEANTRVEVTGQNKNEFVLAAPGNYE